MTVQGQSAITYGYDDVNRLTAITQGPVSITIAYDAAARPGSLTLPGEVVVEFAYDAASQLTGITYSRAGSRVGDLTYAYDAAGKRAAAGGTFARTTLPEPVPSTTYDAANQLTHDQTNSFHYDENGNLTSDGVRTYDWDARTQLAAVNGPGIAASFEYDSFGRRTRKTINGRTTEFLFDGVNVVQESSGGLPVAHLLTGLGMDEYFVRTTANGPQILLFDALGSTLGLLDADGGLRIEYTYEPFGATTATGATGTNPFQFSGRENDGTGLYYYRARYYSTTMRRFISHDPLGFETGNPNLYAYVGNDPVNFVDPTGEFWGIIFAIADVAFQLYENQGNWKCVDWAEVGFSLVAGGALSAVGAGAFRFKTAGRHTWSATRSWMNRRGIQMIRPGQDRHHWLLERNQGIGRFFPDWVKNQPWNTTPISSGFNNWLGRHPSLAWAGAPQWAREVASGGAAWSTGGRDGKGCE